MKRFCFLFLICLNCLLFAEELKVPKYIILFIGDGMSAPQRMLAEEFSRRKGTGPLLINAMPVHSATRTASANAIVTDSAASGTAIATGTKTNNHTVGLGPDGKTRLISCAVVAKQLGKRVGILTTVGINHATPAAFYGHQTNRSLYYELGLDLLDSNFDFFAGSGFISSNNKKSARYRGDLYELTEKAGYTVIRKDKKAFEELKPEKGQKVLVSCTDTDRIPFAIDRKGKESDHITIADMTRKAIELLDNPNGFFMMVEEGSIDYAGHANDAAANLGEVLELEKAVRAAMDFAAAHKDEVLIIVTGDHETGGLTLVDSRSDIKAELLLNQTCSLLAMHPLYEKLKKDPSFTWEEAQRFLTEQFGFKFSGNEKDPMFVNQKESASFKDAYHSGTLLFAARKAFSAKAGLAWTTGGHTSLPVLTTSAGPSAQLFSGMMENTDIARKIKFLLQQK